MSAETRSVALRTLKTAWPNCAGAVVVCGAAFALHVVLVSGPFRDAPSALAHFGVLSQLAAFTCAVGAGALSVGLFRLYPGRPDDRSSLLVTAWVGAAAACAAIIALVQFVPGLAGLLLGDDVAAGLVAPFLWKAPAVAAVAVAAAAMHATNSLRRRAATEAAEGVAAASFAVVGAVWAGLPGLLWGGFCGSVLVGAMLRPRAGGGRIRASSFVELLRSGRAEGGFFAMDALLPLAVLRVANARGPGAVETGSLVAAMGLVAPFVVLPELFERALYPAPIGPGRRAAGLDRVHRRMSVELLGFFVSALLLFVATAAWVLPRLGGGAFSVAASALVVMVPGVAVHAWIASSGRTVLVRDRYAGATLASAAALVVAVVIAWMLVPSHGAVGAGVALSAALAARAVLLLVAARPSRRPPSSPDAPKSLDEVRATADAASFPKQVLVGAPTTVSFFSAAFHGRNDCIHLADGGVVDALLVDIDDDKLAEMRAIYPSTWRCAAGDAYVVAESLRAAGEKFDLVVVDGWTGEAERMLTRNFPLWCALSRRYTVMMAARPWFAAQGIEPTPNAVKDWVKSRHGLDVVVEELHFRADWVGGVWWIVVRT